MLIKDIARVVHEANRALQIVQADPSVPPSAGWDDLDIETKHSAVAGVHAVLEGATPEQSHENWLIFKADRGWRFGPVKDAELRQHPCMVPYDELPAGQQVKDHLFVAIVRTLADA